RIGRTSPANETIRSHLRSRSVEPMGADEGSDPSGKVSAPPGSDATPPGERCASLSDPFDPPGNDPDPTTTRSRYAPAGTIAPDNPTLARMSAPAPMRASAAKIDSGPGRSSSSGGDPVRYASVLPEAS